MAFQGEKPNKQTNGQYKSVRVLQVPREEQPQRFDSLVTFLTIHHRLSRIPLFLCQSISWPLATVRAV
jgi:hypothetical protein